MTSRSSPILSPYYADADIVPSEEKPGQRTLIVFIVGVLTFIFVPSTEFLLLFPALPHRDITPHA